MSVEYSDLLNLQKAVGDTQARQFLEDCTKELASRLLSLVINKTGVITGNLRRGWTGGVSTTPKNFVDAVGIRKEGDTYIIELTNNVEYAIYYEYGHRTKNGKGWVNGKFPMTISENEIRSMSPKLLEQRLKNYLKGVIK